MILTLLRIDMVSLFASGLRRAIPPTIADARRWMQRAKQIYASFELPAHGPVFSPDPRLDGSHRNTEVFGDLLVRAPVDDRQKQARATLWLEVIEHGPWRHGGPAAGRGAWDGVFPLAEGVQRFILERKFPPAVFLHLHLECRVADDRVDPAPGGSACWIEVFGISENLRECIVDDVLRTRRVVDDPARYRAQLVLLPGVDLADGGLRSGGALEQRRFVIESRLATRICLTLRCGGVRLCLCEAGALVGHDP